MIIYQAWISAFVINYSINPNDLSYCKLQIYFILFHYVIILVTFWSLNSCYGSYKDVFKQYPEEYFN